MGVHLLVSPGYGYHRDELYSLAAGQRLAWGYVDQPPVTPAVARLVTEVFGDSLPALRLVPALGHGVLVVLAWLLAREFGGGRIARTLAAATVAASGLFLAIGNSLSTTAVDTVVWVVALFFAGRMLRTRDRRWWVAIGAVCGVGLLNKHTVLLLIGGLAAGVLLTGRRPRRRAPWSPSASTIVRSCSRSSATCGWRAGCPRTRPWCRPSGAHRCGSPATRSTRGTGCGRVSSTTTTPAPTPEHEGRDATAGGAPTRRRSPATLRCRHPVDRSRR